MTRSLRTTATPMRPPRLTGTLFRILDEGFGFIHSDCGGRDHFVSITEMRNRADWQAARAAIADKGGLRVSFCSGAPKAKNQAPRALDVAPLSMDEKEQGYMGV